MKKIYITSVTATGGRNGKVKSDNGVLDLDIRLPKAFGGSSDDHINPEMLFAAGYSACFDSALNVMIKQANLTTRETTVKANVAIGQNENGGFVLEVELDINIPDVTIELANELVKQAHEACPYSNAIKENVQVQLNVTVNN